MTRQEHLDHAGYAFQRMLDNVGTAAFPNRENPDQVEYWAGIMRRRLDLARLAGEGD